VAGGVLTQGIIALARRVANGPPPSPRGCCARTRARWFAAHVAEWLQCTGTFDGLLAASLKFDRLDPDGSTLASFIPVGPLLSESGAVHEGALALLVDTVTSIGQTAAGHLGGLSIEIGVKLHVPIPVGERLVVSTRILKVHRGAVISMEMELRQAVGVNGEEEGTLLASGWHTKSMKAPFRVRLWHGIVVRCLPLYILELRRGLAAAKASDSVKDNMEALLALRREDGIDGGEGVSVLVADITPRLQNLYGISHGAATAALLAAVVREHVKGMHQPLAVPVLADFSVLYLEPVPGGWPAGLAVWQQPPRPGRPEEGGVVRLVAELHMEGRALARANFAAQLPEPPRPRLLPAPARGPMWPQGTDDEKKEDSMEDEASKKGGGEREEKREGNVEEDFEGNEEEQQAQAAQHQEKTEKEQRNGIQSVKADPAKDVFEDDEEEWMRCWREGRPPPLN